MLNPSQGFEAPLDNADLTDPSRYQDSQAPDALPAISVDGSEDQTTYVRPYRGGSDDNARDAVTENGAPITLVVYVNGPPLTVQASAQTLSVDGCGDHREIQCERTDGRRFSGRAISAELELELRRRRHLGGGDAGAPVCRRQLRRDRRGDRCEYRSRGYGHDPVQDPGQPGRGPQDAERRQRAQQVEVSIRRGQGQTQQPPNR